MSAASSSASRSMCEMRSLMFSKVGAAAVAVVAIAAAAVAYAVLRHRQGTTAASTGALALHLDELQDQQGHGPCRTPPSAVSTSRSPTPAPRTGAPSTSRSTS